MRFQNPKMIVRFQLLFFVAALLVMTPGGAVQLHQEGSQLQSLANQPSTQAASVVEQEATRVKRQAPRCAPWASCNGQPLEQRVEKKKAVLLAVMMGLSVRS